MVFSSARRNSVLLTIALIISRRRLLAGSVKIALKQRFAGAALGLVWLVVNPVILLALYAAIYLVIFRIRPVGFEPQIYVLYIFAGLVPLIAFNQGLAAGAVALSANRDVLLNTIFPAELVPLREISTAFVSLAVGLAITCLVGLFLGRIAPAWLLVPAFILLMFLFLAGLTWILALANLVLKDIQQVLSFVSLALLIASPIAYTPDMIPDQLRALIYLNPLAYFVITFQSLIVLGEMPSWPILLGALFFGFGTFALGAFVFSRAKRAFFDYA